MPEAQLEIKVQDIDHLGNIASIWSWHDVATDPTIV